MRALNQKPQNGVDRYLNYAWTEQDPIASYGAENVDLLRRVQSQYDPNRIWEKLVKGGFKIPKA